MKELRGITWNHPRGYAPLKRVTEVFREKKPDINIKWDIRSLKDFGDYPVTNLAEKYDLIILDHPFMGSASVSGALLPLDEWMPESYLAEQQRNSVGRSHISYHYGGHQWALAVDAAAQIASCRMDLLEELGREVPKTWDDVFALMDVLPEGKYVGLPLCPTDVYCTMLSLCANLGSDNFFDPQTGISPEVGIQALQFMKKLSLRLSPESLTMNPIKMYEEMAENDRVVYVPLAFGYSNYARKSREKSKRINFKNIPSFHEKSSGALIGGVGMAVSAYSAFKQEAVDFCMFAANGEVQRTIYYESGGQPGHRSAWEDPAVNEDCSNFFKDTLQSLDLGYLRPRLPKYNVFQEEAGKILHTFLTQKLDESGTINRINALYQEIVFKETKKTVSGPLDGCLVLDLSHHMAGPVAAQKLGDFGADVIKIEAPGYGEWTRTRPIGKGWIGNLNMSLIAVNRNKRSLTLDLKSESGLHIFHQMVEKADIVISNFRPEVNKRLKVDYDTLKAINPGLIYCAITGFGEDGPYAKRPGQDLLVQGLSGVAWNAGRVDDPPIPMGTFAVDVSAGINGLSGVLAALYYREKTGRGQKIAVNMLGSVMDLQIQEFTDYLNTRKLTKRTKELLAHPAINSPYGIHRTKDGFISLAMTPFEKLAKALECPELLRFTTWEDGQIYRDEIFRITADAMLKKTTDEWIKHLDECDVWCGYVKKYNEVAVDPQIVHNRTIQSIEHETYGELKIVANPVSFSETPVTYRVAPAELGAHNYEILSELGYSDEEIEELKDRQVIQNGQPPTFKI